MKGVVVYDTYYGNTKLVAEAIAEQIKTDGHEVDIRSVREDYPSPPQGDFIFVGSPVRMGGVTGRTKRYVKRLGDAWMGKSLIVFTTVSASPRGEIDEKKRKSYEKWALRAGPKLQDLAKSRGLSPLEALLAVPVKTNQGPLVDDGVLMTKQFAHNVLQSIKK